MAEHTKNVMGVRPPEYPGRPCLRCQKPSVNGEIFSVSRNDNRFVCSECAGAPQGLLYSSSWMLFNELSVPPELPALAIGPWTLEHQNFAAAYGSAAVVGVVWRCVVLAPFAVDNHSSRGS